MKIQLARLRQPSLPSAQVLAAHAPAVGQIAAPVMPTYLAAGAAGVGGNGINVPTDPTIAGASAAVTLRFIGDARGVPPRGRPV